VLAGSYVLGSVPSAFLAGKWSRGIDIRRHGSGNVGATNLMLFTSRRAVIPVVVFDSIKGMLAIVIAWRTGLGLGGQALAGLAAITGHNWPCFLRFQGGRGVITTLGVSFFLPLINRSVPLLVLSLVGLGFGSLALLTAHFKRLPLGVFLIVALFPLFGWFVAHSLVLTLGYLGMFGLMVVRRLTAPQPIKVTSISRKQVLLNRLLFDRDLRDKEAWMSIVIEEQKNQRRLAETRE